MARSTRSLLPSSLKLSQVFAGPRAQPGPYRQPSVLTGTVEATEWVIGAVRRAQYSRPPSPRAFRKYQRRSN